MITTIVVCAVLVVALVAFWTWRDNKKFGKIGGRDISRNSYSDTSSSFMWLDFSGGDCGSGDSGDCGD